MIVSTTHSEDLRFQSSPVVLRGWQSWALWVAHGAAFSGAVYVAYRRCVRRGHPRYR